ncbi:MAG: hypothetical protein SNJ67_05860 [Chloracidobacterium sp.]
MARGYPRPCGTGRQVTGRERATNKKLYSPVTRDVTLPPLYRKIEFRLRLKQYSFLERGRPVIDEE